MKTPIQKAIAQLEYAIKSATEVMHEKSGTDEAVMMGQVMFQQNFLKYLQSLLPYEQECFVGAFNSGFDTGAILSDTRVADYESALDYFNQTYNQ